MPSPLGRVTEHSEVGRGANVPKCGIFRYIVLPSSVTPIGVPPSPKGKAFLQLQHEFQHFFLIDDAGMALGFALEGSQILRRGDLGHGFQPLHEGEFIAA